MTKYQSKINSINQYQEYQSKILFTCTIRSISKYKFQKRDFDYVVVDEASLIIEPELIRALMYGKKFILYGDHKQLSPLIKTKNNILSKSLFEKLCVNYPNKVT